MSIMSMCWKPIRQQFFRISQPRPPAPTIRMETEEERRDFVEMEGRKRGHWKGEGSSR
jgi:hypothetical protein